jgi:hypothetical protein
MTPRFSSTKRGAALLIVLAFLVILSGIVIAYLTRSSADRQLAHGSFNNVKADQLAKSAVELVVGDLKQEIAAGTPITSSNVVPQRSPKPAAGALPWSGIPNLIRRSVRSDGIASPAIPSRASAVNSTVDVSRNGRSVSLALWNAHYIVPKVSTGDDRADPVTTGFVAPNYWAPDWVIVTRNGPTKFDTWAPSLADSTATNTEFAVGRYAFAIYDEGGLLDANVVGLPSPTPGITDVGRKGNVALADLTGMKYTPAGTTATAGTISKIVGWRNYATVKTSGTFPSLSPTPDPSLFMNYFLDRTNEFRAVANTVYLGRTDQAFLNRRELIEFFRSAGLSFNMLQFLGTFSRERNIPTFKAGTANLRARFAIGNLALLRDNPDATQKADIQKFFGLKWVVGSPGTGGASSIPAIPGHWQYVGKTGSTLQDKIPAFATDPEFFQLLNYAVYSTNSDDSSHIATTLSVGATIIDQYDDDTSSDPTTTTTSTMIEYAGGNWAVGMENVDPARASPTPAPSPFPSPAGMSPTPRPFITGYAMLNRPFRNVGEFGYALRPEKTPPPQTIDFATAASADAPILDLFTYNTAATRAGIVNLNTTNPAVFAALLKSANLTEAVPSPGVGLAAANNAAASPTPNATSGIIGHTTLGTLAQPALGRSDVARLVQATGTSIGSTEEQKETTARAIAEVSQTRTWGLFIDVIAQAGRYPPTAAGLEEFIVEGEKRYWLHIAIDRLTGEVIDQQLEAVEE